MVSPVRSTTVFFTRARTNLVLDNGHRRTLVRVTGTIAAPDSLTSELSGRLASAFRFVLGVARPFAQTRVIVDELGFAPVLGGWLGKELAIEVDGQRLVVPLAEAHLLTPFTGTGAVLGKTLPEELDSAWQARRPRDGVIYFAEHPLTCGSHVQVEGTVERAHREGYRASASVYNEDFRMVSGERISLWEL